MGGAIEAFGRWDTQLWSKSSEHQPWNYGYMATQVKLGTQGLYEAALLFAPISFLELSYSKSGTSRFYESKVFDCSTYECKGMLFRDRLSLKFAMGYQDYYFVPVFQVTKVTFGQSQQLTVDESENLLLQSDADYLRTTTLVIGKKHGNSSYSLVSRKSEYEFSKMQNETLLFVASKKETDPNCFKELCSDKTYGVGFGPYASNSTPFKKSTLNALAINSNGSEQSEIIKGFSIVAFFKWSWGKSLGYF